MNGKLSILKFALKRFLFLIKDRGVAYALSRAIEKRKQLVSMILSFKARRGTSQRFNPAIAHPRDFLAVEGKVSVIIPIYDRTWELKEAIESILDQTYNNIELLLICDGSPKSTIEVVEEYRSNKKVKIFKYPHASGNAVRGRNKGIIESTGEFIAFLDSDDIALPNRIELSVDFLNSSESYHGVYGSWEALIDGSREIAGIDNGMIVHSPDGGLQEHIEHCIPCQSTVLLRKSALISVGGINSKMQYREDHELWARLHYFGYRMKSLNEVLVKLRLHEGNNELNFSKDENTDIWKRELLHEYNNNVSLRKKICWIVAGLGISGGLAVILKHANYLLSKGHDVSLITLSDETSVDWTKNNVPVYNIKDEYALDNMDLLIATAWNTEPYLDKLDAKRKLYFVQSDERRFIDEKTIINTIKEGYSQGYEYFTEAYWIQDMFHKEFKRSAFYVPNGIDSSFFNPHSPLEPRGKRKRVLIEGPIDIPFKAVEDSYNAVKDLDCEIWIVSSSGKPKDDWRCDRFFERVPQKEMPSIYASCDIFIKMSRIEGFFGPPLEAMACECVPVVGKVSGWNEYIVDEQNALAVELYDVESAKLCVERLLSDDALYNKLKSNGRKTVDEWSWDKSYQRISSLVNRS
ncbi:putative glycosyl transferase [Vibrio nigripulchritudo SFn27]|uniref:Putative glycosyl transferase n=1 Tax=Vibrio nigripulchritudo TaxID=28173 RepID=U4KA42_9VIBR|nr:glycosyltransferase [Vibrio nigripulchritudo]CCN81685.1 putative glycosyl transferase [Vibrio nigripulchritudo BLFn1]CCN91532.1 putative glycosyl transferase [Vibrio nigripulchritudo SFn27]CCN95673.1 putative glycosyl transferase [Vibrio nigripulchritudo ENn2]CCO39488.1 putative glycosyl transferase [Vibrio nigripulchritudo SFn135]CCO51168.1 putative glycosyl transferase [Vibrio nigripulchritudo Wn13]